MTPSQPPSTTSTTTNTPTKNTTTGSNTLGNWEHPAFSEAVKKRAAGFNDGDVALLKRSVFWIAVLFGVYSYYDAKSVCLWGKRNISSDMVNYNVLCTTTFQTGMSFILFNSLFSFTCLIPCYYLHSLQINILHHLHNNSLRNRLPRIQILYPRKRLRWQRNDAKMERTRSKTTTTILYSTFDIRKIKCSTITRLNSRLNTNRCHIQKSRSPFSTRFQCITKTVPERCSSKT